MNEFKINNNEEIKVSKVYFGNNGYLDPKAMLTFGVSVKDEHSIGYFGTGLKYSIAIILRNGGSISIDTCGEKYIFNKNKDEIKGKEFDVVYCNGSPAGFTTHLGINWKPWMAYRELYSNCSDEGGVVTENKEMVFNFDTVVTVDCPEIYRAYLNTSKYFLDDEPIESTKFADIHKKRSNFVYYKGVAVYEAKTKYSYNLKRAELTEDRTLAYEFYLRQGVQQAIQSLDNESLLRDILLPGDNYEAVMSFDVDWETSETFIKTASSMMRTDVGISLPARDLMKEIDYKKGDWPEFELTNTQKMMLKNAIDFLSGIGISVTDFHIKNVIGLGDGVMGMAKNGMIYLSDLPYQMGTKQLASTLMEEWVHNKLGCKDFDIKMQNWLFDKILSVAEELNGRPI